MFPAEMVPHKQRGDHLWPRCFPFCLTSSELQTVTCVLAGLPLDMLGSGADLDFHPMKLVTVLTSRP